MIATWADALSAMIIVIVNGFMRRGPCLRYVSTHSNQDCSPPRAVPMMTPTSSAFDSSIVRWACWTAWAADGDGELRKAVAPPRFFALHVIAPDQSP